MYKFVAILNNCFYICSIKFLNKHMRHFKNFISLLLTIGFLFNSTKTFALIYTISFTGSGASTTVDNVVVQNLNKGTAVTVVAGSTLTLSDLINGINDIQTNQDEIRVISTSENGNYLLSFFSKSFSSTQIAIYNIDGRKVAGINTNLQTGLSSFKLALPKGLYVAYVSGAGYAYSKKIISYSGNINKPDLSFLSSDKSASASPKKAKADNSISLSYSAGDRLLFKGVSGNFSTISTDIPTESKTINFEFVECKDKNGNYYPVVKIGQQTWMAENLKASKYRSGDDITNLTNNTDWGLYAISSWCSYNNNAANDVNGKLYNWYVASDSRNIAPLGWHVASDVDWTALTTSLGGETMAGAKLKETGLAHWSTTNNYATNESGFTALAAGNRLTSGLFENLANNAYWWSSTANSSTNGWYRYITKTATNVTRDYSAKNAGFSIRCVKDANLPTLTTSAPTSITYTTAVGGGNISSDGGAPITARGVCWSLTPNPTISNNKSVAGIATGTGTFTSSISGLNINTTYYVKAYATNSSGTAYGEQQVFNSKPYDNLTVTDIDGNLYHTVTIGNQTWMAENLKTTRYRNGDAITNITDNYQWINANAGAYCWYDNDILNGVIYGALYNYFAVNDSRKIAPAGWHIPSKEEWLTLINFLGGESVAGGKMKTTGTNYWLSPNEGASNLSGFNALPGGYRQKGTGVFLYKGTNCFFRTSNEELESGYDNSWHIMLLNQNANTTTTFAQKTFGFSVRCIQNTTPSLTTNLPISILTTSATCGGNITSNGSDTVTDYGVCWSKSENPTTADSKKSIGSGNGTFSSSIIGLDINTTYYVRAYATNSIGTAYGQQVTLKTLATDPITVTDIDGNVYHTITIGTQTWMVENFKAERYNDGTPMNFTTSGYSWLQQTTGAYCWAQDDASYKNTFGAFYNWYAVNSGKLAPVGWRIPTEQDWINLSSYLGGGTIAGGKLKGTDYWTAPNIGATNESGFNALPAGYRSKNNGSNPGMGDVAVFWSSSSSINSYGRLALDYTNSIFNYGIESGNFGINVRCIKNND